MKKDNRTFEECLPIVNQCLERYRSRWTLTSLSWFDYDDVKSTITIHILKKWNKRDKTKDLKPWLLTVISNQLKNIVRNHYDKFKRPCLSCKHILNGTDCALYDSQCEECPLYAKWMKAKARGYEMNYPSSYSNPEDPSSNQQAHSVAGGLVDFPDDLLFKIKEELKKVLSKEIYSKFMVEHYFKTSSKEVKLSLKERKKIEVEVKKILERIGY